jgi:hypothetical protein
MAVGTDGSDAIRELWLTPHLHMKSGWRKNANDVGVEAWAAKHSKARA